jgi:hypothetical protein
MRQGHANDVFVPVDPATLPARLAAAGFADVRVDVDVYQLRFSAAMR